MGRSRVERNRGSSDRVPDIRLVSLKSVVFGAMHEEAFDATGWSRSGLAIKSTTLAQAMGEVYEELRANCGRDTKHRMRGVLTNPLRSPAEESLPLEG